MDGNYGSSEITLDFPTIKKPSLKKPKIEKPISSLRSYSSLPRQLKDSFYIDEQKTSYKAPTIKKPVEKEYSYASYNSLSFKDSSLNDYDTPKQV